MDTPSARLPLYIAQNPPAAAITNFWTIPFFVNSGVEM